MAKKSGYESDSHGYQRPGKNVVVLAYDSLVLIFFSLPFLLVGILFIVMPWGLATNSDKIALGYKFLISGMGLLATLVPYAMYKTGLNETVLDRSHNRIYIRKRFTNKITRQFDVAAVDSAIIDDYSDSEGTSYKIALRLKSGEKVSLGNSLSATRASAVEKRDRINRLLQNPYDTSARPGSNEWQAAGQSESLRIFIFVCVIVIIAPFAGWYIAAQEKPSVNVIAGTPSESLATELKQRAGAKFEPGETIQFVAMPEPGHEGKVKIWFMPFAIIWTIFSGCFTFIALYSAVQSRSFGAAFMALFGLPFLAMGVGMLLTPYFSYKRELKTIYALTDKRAVAFEEQSVREIVEYRDRHFGPVLTKPYEGGRADLMFRSNLDSESPGVTGGFWGIEKANEAAAILEQKLREKTMPER